MELKSPKNRSFSWSLYGDFLFTAFFAFHFYWLLPFNFMYNFDFTYYITDDAFAILMSLDYEE